MSTRTKIVLGAGAGVIALAVGVFFLMGGEAEDIPGVNKIVEEPTCPLTGEEPKNEAALDKPAVAVKVENNPAAYPLSGLDKANVVYEEPVEGGITRFMAIFHCSNSSKVGPVRSARMVDPAIMSPYTRILGDAGGNDFVKQALADADIISIDEPAAGEAMMRVERPGIASEHTLYADVAALRKLGRKKFDDPPADDIFRFGDLEGKSKKATTIEVHFSATGTMSYEYDGERYLRFDDGEPLVAESGTQYATDNVLIEEHIVNFSTIVDVAGNPSIEIEDVTGSGRAVLFRDGRAIKGRWVREAADEAVTFETKAGDEMVLAPGSTWIELVPNKTGDVKGSFSYAP